MICSASNTITMSLLILSIFVSQWIICAIPYLRAQVGSSLLRLSSSFIYRLLLYFSTLCHTLCSHLYIYESVLVSCAVNFSSILLSALFSPQLCSVRQLLFSSFLSTILSTGSLFTPHSFGHFSFSHTPYNFLAGTLCTPTLISMNPVETSGSLHIPCSFLSSLLRVQNVFTYRHNQFC